MDLHSTIGNNNHFRLLIIVNSNIFNNNSPGSNNQCIAGKCDVCPPARIPPDISKVINYLFQFQFDLC